MTGYHLPCFGSKRTGCFGDAGSSRWIFNLRFSRSAAVFRGNTAVFEIGCVRFWPWGVPCSNSARSVTAKDGKTVDFFGCASFQRSTKPLAEKRACADKGHIHPAYPPCASVLLQMPEECTPLTFVAPFFTDAGATSRLPHTLHSSESNRTDNM